MITKTLFITIHQIVLTIIVGLILSTVGYGQHVYISGTAEGSSNQLIRVIVYDDQFSRLEKTIAETYSDSSGNLEINFDTEKSNFAYMAVGLKRGEFYLSQNSSYQFNILPDTNTQPGSIFDELPLQFTYTANDNGLSDAIGTFNVQYNTFIYQNANKIYYGRNKDFIYGFEDKINEQFTSVNNSYLEDYIRYSFASLEWTSKIKNNDSIVSEYFIGNPILFNNIQYTEFFTDFFKTYFIVEKIYSYHELIDAINEGSGIQDIKSLILREVIFKNDPELTELISILLVAKKYYNPDIRRNLIIKLLQEVESISRYPMNAKVAGNFIKKLQNLESGTPAPGFSLPDIDDNKHNLIDYEGKFVLLSYVKPSCKICLEHFQYLKEVAEQFNGRVQNVSVVYGEDFQGVVRYASDRDFSWPILDLGKQILLLEVYNIRAYPSYVFINPDGTIALATTPMPDEGLEIYLNRQIKKFDNQ